MIPRRGPHVPLMYCKLRVCSKQSFCSGTSCSIASHAVKNAPCTGSHLTPSSGPQSTHKGRLYSLASKPLQASSVRAILRRVVLARPAWDRYAPRRVAMLVAIREVSRPNYQRVRLAPGVRRRSVVESRAEDGAAQPRHKNNGAALGEIAGGKRRREEKARPKHPRR